MKLFIWHHAANVTDHYHNEAGVVVLAHSLEQARAIFIAERNAYYGTDPDDDPPQVLTKDPDEIHDLSETKAWIFRDAGCC